MLLSQGENNQIHDLSIILKKSYLVSDEQTWCLMKEMQFGLSHIPLEFISEKHLLMLND